MHYRLTPSRLYPALDFLCRCHISSGFEVNSWLHFAKECIPSFLGNLCELHLGIREQILAWRTKWHSSEKHWRIYGLCRTLTQWNKYIFPSTDCKSRIKFHAVWQNQGALPATEGCSNQWKSLAEKVFCVDGMGRWFRLYTAVVFMAISHLFRQICCGCAMHTQYCSRGQLLCT